MPRSKATSTILRLVGGKGGVGKTTCAAAQAAAEARRGRRTLVVSTDPAPSLGDVFGIALGSGPRRIPLARGTLYAAEVDAARAFRRWFRVRRSAFETIALRGTWLDRDDVRKLFDLAPPGVDEIAALFDVLRYYQSADYDVVVVDTAPTGHTLRMLAMPETFSGLARAFAAMHAKHRALVEAFQGGAAADDSDRVIQDLEESARAFSELIRDRERTEVSLVTLPEALAIEETLDLARHLRARGISLARVIVNRLTPVAPDPCGWCAGKRTSERRAVMHLVRGLRRVTGNGLAALPCIVAVDELEREPVGPRALSAVAQKLERAWPIEQASRRDGVRAVRTAALPFRFPCDPFEASLRLLLFGGKGGVGKTTCAAAAALQMAADSPKRRILLASVDPAHSLSDVLDLPLGDESRRIPGAPANLEVRELDAAVAFDALRAEYTHAVDAQFDRLHRRSNMDASYDRAILDELLNLAPPGLDEIAAVLRVTDLLGIREAASRYDLVILDTAPTGHALRLLETPAIVREWTRALMSIVLKYQPAIGIGQLGAPLLRMSQALGRLRELIASRETSFMLVTRVGAVTSVETRRLHRRLDRLGVPVPAVIVNAMGAGECRRCRQTLRAQTERTTGALVRPRGPKGRLHLIGAPATVPPPAGVKALLRWRGKWRCSEESRRTGGAAVRKERGQLG